MEDLIKENKMGTEKIPKVLFSLAVPIIISMLVQALYNIVDSVFVAQYNNNEGTAALTIAFPIQNLMIAVAAGLGVGMNALLSRSLGQKNFDKANKVAGQGIFLTLCGYLISLYSVLSVLPLLLHLKPTATSFFINIHTTIYQSFLLELSEYFFK